MSEYWKSTTFVRDSKLERTNHEATPKHQGNIKRFIRDLHRGHEKDEREKQKAKNEVERLNGVVSATSTSALGSGEAPWKRTSTIPLSNPGSRQATPAERKAQLAQLAAMGVAVPEGFRREMAMAGDWETVSETPVYDEVVKKEDTKDTKSSVLKDGPSQLNIGIRKRKYEGQEEEEEAGEKVVRKGWGLTTKDYPGTSSDMDLDALLNNKRPSTSIGSNSGDNAVESMQAIPGKSFSGIPSKPESETPTAPSEPSIKREDSIPDELGAGLDPHPDGQPATLKHEDDAATGGIVFKKRKAKPIRSK
ncbi:MAG: hypothetical protein Q9195_008036 [Heterodermia aff. obscurata]